MAYSPDGTQIVSGGDDGTVRVWDAQSGEELRQFTGHTGPVNAVAYSPDGMQIVSASNDQTVRVWDVSTTLNTRAQSGAELQRVTVHTGPVNAVAYSPDGTRIVSGSGDNTLRLWYADVPYLLRLAESLIQRDPPVFVGEERGRYRFDEWPALGGH